MIVNYKYRTTEIGTIPKGKGARFQCDSDEIKQIFKACGDTIMWMVVDFPNGEHWYFNCGHWTKFNSYKQFMQ